ncbi:hypothetical protein [Wohlfahrtiimonas larvae]|uniref:hypothetical protein n=1 Tax=Wohlfahrtiimonas larvae TaxID=1157986 RepID=UPI0031E85DED
MKDEQIENIITAEKTSPNCKIDINSPACRQDVKKALIIGLKDFNEETQGQTVGFLVTAGFLVVFSLTRTPQKSPFLWAFVCFVG